MPTCPKDTDQRVSVPLSNRHAPKTQKNEGFKERCSKEAIAIISKGEKKNESESKDGRKAFE